jgi:hypothetical protein
VFAGSDCWVFRPNAHRYPARVSARSERNGPDGFPDADTLPASVTQAHLALRVRRELAYLLCDDSTDEPSGFALYTLADPRDVRCVRYVGQTCAPRRRYLQHVRTARLWLAADTPWWIRLPRLRALYVWMRELYREDGRLPFMLVSGWLTTAAEVRLRERQLIAELAQRGLPLLNIEAERLRTPRLASTSRRVSGRARRSPAARSSSGH